MVWFPVIIRNYYFLMTILDNFIMEVETQNVFNKKSPRSDDGHLNLVQSVRSELDIILDLIYKFLDLGKSTVIAMPVLLLSSGDSD